MYINAENPAIWVIQMRPKFPTPKEYRTWRTMECPINGIELFADKQQAIDQAVEYAKGDTKNGYRAQRYALKRLLGPTRDLFLIIPGEEADNA